MSGTWPVAPAPLPCGHPRRFLLPSGDCDACLDLAWFRAQDIAFDGVDHCAGGHDQRH